MHIDENILFLISMGYFTNEECFWIFWQPKKSCNGVRNTCKCSQPVIYMDFWKSIWLFWFEKIYCKHLCLLFHIFHFSCLIAHLLSLILRPILLLKCGFEVGKNMHVLWSNLISLQELMEGQVLTISKLATNETKVAHQLHLAWKSEQKAPDILSLWKPQAKICF